MNKMMFEDAYILSASVKDDVKKEGDKWVPLGTKKLELVLLVDVMDDKLSTGKVKYITSVKEPSFDVDALLAKLHRFDKVSVTATVYEYGDRTDYRFFRIICDGVDLTAAAANLSEVSGIGLPF